jgi:two-component system, cell cycle response regulator
MKILIIDDNPDALEVARTRLAKECVDIICADGGNAGMEAARREKPDLILLDLDMPDICGFDVCRILKADPDLSMTPILFLSGSGTAEDKVRGLDLGAVDYVTKPFDAFELRARVRAALRTKQLQDLLNEHAHLDPLTGLPNRRAIMERLQQEWARMERHGGPLSFIMADLDQFKKVNDTYGHNVGDQLLQMVAKALAQQCREVDLPARYGGDEFAIVVPNELAGAAIHLAERCRQAVEKGSLSARGETIRATASFGVAEAPGPSSPEALIERADKALYQAKEAGRNQVRGYGRELP